MTSFLSKEHEPLRRYLYGVGVVVLGLLVTLGVVTDEIAYGVGAVLSAALLVPAVELARSKVTPVVEAEVEEPYVDEVPDDGYLARHAAP